MLSAILLASVCALTTTGVTTAPLHDVELSDTNVIVAATPPAESIVVVQVESTTTTTEVSVASAVGG